MSGDGSSRHSRTRGRTWPARGWRRLAGRCPTGRRSGPDSPPAQQVVVPVRVPLGPPEEEPVEVPLHVRDHAVAGVRQPPRVVPAPGFRRVPGDTSRYFPDGEGCTCSDPATRWSSVTNASTSRRCARYHSAGRALRLAGQHPPFQRPEQPRLHTKSNTLRVTSCPLGRWQRVDHRGSGRHQRMPASPRPLRREGRRGTAPSTAPARASPRGRAGRTSW